ncbi:MAG: hypothetical protein EOM26_08475 [Alphaproteobacteria bacterium]|nr:hypothetical protein [Alphaproteobacteria bacterium]
MTTPGNRIENWLKGTIGFLLAFVILPALPVIFVQTAVLCSSRLVLPLFLLAGFLFRMSRIAGSVAVLLLGGLGGLGFIISVFRLSLADTWHAVFHDSGDIALFADPFYATAFGTTVAAVLGTLLIGWRYRPRPHLAGTLVLASLIFVLVALQIRGRSGANEWPRYTVGEPVPSAMVASGFRDDVLTEVRPSLFVIVEGLGAYTDQETLDAVLRPLLGVDGRHVTRGLIDSAGSTTAAELRELCGLHGSHGDVRKADLDLSTCLPRVLAERGRDVIALHGFKASMFDREAWYPDIGISRHFFGFDATDNPDPALCSSVFRGLCDFEIAPKVERLLREATEANEASLVYWLTLNSHIPAIAHESLPDIFACKSQNPVFADPDVCALGTIWHGLAENIAVIAEKNPEVGILLVGDHPPPVLSHAGRAAFHAYRVPWIRLHPVRNLDPEK